MTIKIYNFPRGARGLRAMWVCEEMGLAYEVEKVTFPPDEAYRKLNPMGSVPFLADGAVAINESVAIMLYLAERYGPTPLLPARDDPAFARVMQLCVFSEATLGALLNTLMAARFVAPEADKRNWSVTSTEGRVDQALAYVEHLLGDHAYVAGASFSLADIAITTALGMRAGALGQAPSPKLGAYRERMMARPAYERAKARAAG
jgi:glutathione S-transferase